MSVNFNGSTGTMTVMGNSVELDSGTAQYGNELAQILTHLGGRLSSAQVQTITPIVRNLFNRGRSGSRSAMVELIVRASRMIGLTTYEAFIEAARTMNFRVSSAVASHLEEGFEVEVYEDPNTASTPTEEVAHVQAERDIPSEDGVVSLTYTVTFTIDPTDASQVSRTASVLSIAAMGGVDPQVSVTAS